MATADTDPRAYPLRLEGDYAEEPLFLVAAVVEEGINVLTHVDVEFVAGNRSIDLDQIVGKRMRVVMEAPDDRRRHFPGICVAAEYLGATSGSGHYRLELRPWLWFLTRTTDSRVFQQLSVVAIAKKILGEYGFSAQVDDRLTGTHRERDFVVQYNETDLAFLTRLMEEEGIYWFFTPQDGQEKLVLADSISAHRPVQGNSRIRYIAREPGPRRQVDHIYDLGSGEGVTSGKVTLDDYDFERPNSDLVASRVTRKGRHPRTDYELYEYPGFYRTAADGEDFARVRMEAEAARHKLVDGTGSVSTLAVGETFELVDHPRLDQNAGLTLIHARHEFQLLTERTPPLGVTRVLTEGLAFTPDEGTNDHYRVRFKAMPKAEPYRAPLTTPRPRIAGIQTAVVTGPAGEEIHTDKYGRVKIQFHWDREGRNDENSSCWARVMMPWTGKSWGAMGIPRIGQEVVVQFEEGNPDRPLVIGMLYNGNTMPPWALPGNMTQTGLVTRSTKGGNADTFHELVFEDKKDAELVRFQSERDYRQVVKNNADVTVGLEHQSDGNMTLTVHKDLTETVKTGDHTFAVETGSQKIDIKTDKTETIEGKSTQTITGNVTETVKQGNVTRTLDMGNEKTTVKLGNWNLETSVGSIGGKAMQEIKLEVGQNSITINQMGVTIKGIMVKIEGTAMLDAKAPMTTVKGDALLILKGGLTMIN